MTKIPYIDGKLYRQINENRSTTTKKTFKTWSRSSTILPLMVGHTIAIHNGKEHIPVFISDQMVGHKLGEFAPTRSFEGHIKTDKKTRR